MTAEQMKYEFDVGYDRITNFDAPGYVPKEISTFLTKAQEGLTYEILKSSANKERNKKAVSMLRQVLPLTSFSAGNYPNGFRTSLQISIGGGTESDIDFAVSPDPDLIIDGQGRFMDAGLRVGDTVTVTGASNSGNNGNFSIISLTPGELRISSRTPLGANEASTVGVQITADPILRVRNERADVTLIAGNFYFDKIENNAVFDVEVDPIDDDFYSANKANPYKRPVISASAKKLWRIDDGGISNKSHEYITDGTFTLSTLHLHIDRKPRAIVVPETTSVPYVVEDGDIDGIYFVDYRTGLDCLLDQSIHRDIVEKAIKLAYAALQDEKGFQISSVQEQQE